MINGLKTVAAEKSLGYKRFFSGNFFSLSFSLRISFKR
jgi:hypothetical protein